VYLRTVNSNEGKQNRGKIKTRSSAIAEIARVGGHYAVQGHLK